MALRSSFVVDLSAFAIPEIGTTRPVDDRYVCGSVIGRNNAGLTRQGPEGLQQTVAVLRFSLVISPCSVPPSSVVNSTPRRLQNLRQSFRTAKALSTPTLARLMSW